MPNNDKTNSRSKLLSFKALVAVATVAAVVLVVFWIKVVRGREDPTSHLATFVAKRGSLTISVLESGTILPRDQITLRDEVEGRTSIVSLVPDGSLVKKGDVLVELDASTLKDQIIDQDIMVQKAKAAYTSAIENLAVIENQARSDTEKADLTLRFARQDLEQYQEGLYPKDVNDLQAKIRLAQEQVKRAEDVNDWSKKLYQEKYLSETEYTADRLSLQGRVLERDVALSNLELMKNFTHQRQIDQLTSDVNQAEMAKERTQRKASADVMTAEAELKARELEYQRQQEKMKKVQDQLSKTTIIAPMDGMVVYATSSGGGHGPFDRREPMDIGVEVTERQDLITLPTTQSMNAKVSIHETSLRKVHEGLPAIITVDALSGKKFLGRVDNIAPLADARMMYMNPDLKVYPTDIILEDMDPALRTGMSCNAEIIVAQYPDAVYVPVQAVLRIGGKPTLFVVKDGSIEERQVEVGLDDNNVIRIISGLAEGEVVLMAPPLKSATVEPGAKIPGLGSFNDVNAPNVMMDRVNQKLEEANGTGGRAGKMQAAGSQGRQGPPSDQTEQTPRRLNNMSPEERQKEMENVKRRMESMTPEEREQMRQRFQSQGGGSRQGRGQRQADGQPSEGGQRSPGPERNQ